MRSKLPFHIMGKVFFSLAGVALAVHVVCICILSWVPPVSRDALTHHLFVPKLYLQGGIRDLPWVMASYNPANLDLLYLMALALGNDIVPKFIHFGFGLLTAWLIYTYLKRRLGTWHGIYGPLFFLSIPIVTRLSVNVYVDLGLGFFSTAALLALARWTEDRFPLKHLIYSAIWCGLALGTKYNGLVVFFLYAMMVPFVYSALTDNTLANQVNALKAGVVFGVIAIAVFSPWMIRNYVWTQNPIYPLYDRQINPQRYSGNPHDSQIDWRQLAYQDSWRETLDFAGGHFNIRKLVYGESWWETVTIPVRIFFQGKDDQPRYFDGTLNPFLLILPLIACIGFRNPELFPRGVTYFERRVFPAFSVLLILLVFLTTALRVRYLIPVIPVLVILSVFGLYVISAYLDRWRVVKWAKVVILVAVIGVMLGINTRYLMDQFVKIDPIPYITGKISRDAYIRRYRPEYPVIQYANQHLHGNVHILCLFLGRRGYYFDHRIFFGNNLFLRMVRESRDPGELKFRLQKLGFTHIIVRFDLFNKWMREMVNAQQQETVRNFFQHQAEGIVSNGDYGLYQLGKFHNGFEKEMGPGRSDR